MMELLEKGSLVVGGLFIRVEVVVGVVVLLVVDDDVVEDDGEDLAWRRVAVRHR